MKSTDKQTPKQAAPDVSELMHRYRLAAMYTINGARNGPLPLGRTKIYELVASGDIRLVKVAGRSMISGTSLAILVHRLEQRPAA